MSCVGLWIPSLPPGAPWRGVVSEKGCDLTWRKAHREPQREADNQSQNRRKVTD